MLMFAQDSSTMNDYTQIGTSMANILARSYSPLLYPKKLRDLLESVSPGSDYSGHDKYALHLEVNNLLLKSYQGEELIKYQIAKHYLSKDTVAAFEIKVGNSRADLASINGVSRCYEIKTELDNLSKLIKQSNDYSAVFEYNTIILDEKHLIRARQYLPEEYGIMIIGRNSLVHHRRARKNLNTCARRQLEMLTSKEIILCFGNGKSDIDLILDSLSPAVINKRFKIALKKRYQDRWDFICKNQAQILPIDFQFFFSTLESPSLLYQRNF
jgi:hypothetical protein